MLKQGPEAGPSLEPTWSRFSVACSWALPGPRGVLGVRPGGGALFCVWRPRLVLEASEDCEVSARTLMANPL